MKSKKETNFRLNLTKSKIAKMKTTYQVKGGNDSYPKSLPNQNYNLC